MVLGVTVGGLNIAELSKLSVKKIREFLSQLELTETQRRPPIHWGGG